MIKRDVLVLVCLALMLVAVPPQRAQAVPPTQGPAQTRARDWVQETAADFAVGRIVLRWGSPSEGHESSTENCQESRAGLLRELSPHTMFAALRRFWSSAAE